MITVVSLSHSTGGFSFTQDNRVDVSLILNKHVEFFHWSQVSRAQGTSIQSVSNDASITSKTLLHDGDDGGPA